jgi:tetratricopeptide (TPR) repeat protein/O-antigen ligase
MSFRQKDPAWVLLLIFPIAVPLAYHPSIPQLKRAVALLLITAAISILLFQGRGPSLGKFLVTSIRLPTLLVLAVATASLAVATNWYEGALALYLHALLSLGPLVWMAATIRGRDQIRRLLGAVCLAASVAGGLGIVQHFLPRSAVAFGAGGAAIGTTGNVNYLGSYLAIAGPIAAGLWMAGPSRVSRGLGLISLGVVTVALIVTRVRAAWLGYLGGLAALAFLMVARWFRRANRGCGPPWKGLRGPTLIATVLAAFLLGGAVAAWRGHSLVGRFLSIFDPGDSSVRARLQWWRDALDMVREHAVLGVGIGNSPSVLFRYNRVPEPSPMLALHLEHLHSEPLALAAELGLAGLAAVSFFLVRLSRLARRAILGGDGSGDFLGMAAVSGLVGAAIDSLFFFNLHEITSASCIWLLVGLVEAIAVLPSTQPSPTAGHLSQAGAGRWWRQGRSPIWDCASFGANVALAALLWLLGVRPAIAASMTQRGRVELHAGRVSEAVAALEAARAWDPGHLAAHYALGQALHEQGRTEEAIGAFQEVLRINPLDLGALNYVGFLHATAGRTAAARAAYQRSLAINPYVGSTHKYLGDLLLAEGRPSEALAQYRRALDLVPRHPAAANALAITYVQLGRTEEAEAAFRQAVASDPGFVEAWLILFMLSGRRQDWPGAARALAEVIRLRPEKKAEARRAPFFDQVWAAGVSLGIFQAGRR